MTARILPFTGRTRRDAETFTAWEALPGAVIFTAGRHGRAREFHLSPQQARRWSDYFAAMALAAERLEDECNH